MFSKHSIRKDFLIQIVISTLALIFTFSLILYFFIEKSIYDEKHAQLLKYAQNISNHQSLFKEDENFSENFFSLTVEIVYLKDENVSISEYEKTVGLHTYLTLIYPFDLKENAYLRITQDISSTKHLLHIILKYIFFINIAGFLLVVLYAITLSNMLIRPIKHLSAKLSNMNEHLLKPIDTTTLPKEFEPLGEILNHLIARIQNFVKYQKELFIGTAHELKTPLAVIKLKNQVTLIKKRSPQEYIEALNNTNKSVDEMNIIVSNILNIGRQEGAQLEKPVQVDVISILKQKANDFKLLASHEGKELKMSFEPNAFMAMLQVSLLNQIVQNFLQNALKFTPKDKTVILRSSQDDYGLLIEVIDEGCGIDDSVDLFAPFVRQGNRQGVGLGLFLAQSAADALGAKIKIRNREDGIDGTVASLQLNSKLSCIIPRYK
ncbi:MAG: HAMP domain-containing sensor histidine kinase [Sulfurimonas sp.]|nr:HAMP domain-containing sensor histidine kinase [Sulfurimonas sp.]